jgi:hypothetical protein
VLASIANGENFPLMPIGFVPVDHSSAIVGVDPHVDWTSNCAPILDSSCLDPLEDVVELFLLDTEAEVMD